MRCNGGGTPVVTGPGDAAATRPSVEAAAATPAAGRGRPSASESAALQGRAAIARNRPEEEEVPEWE
ncbi:hypothetical protein KM043_010895 [Ampulex compressa]|nr:hypothetical protein KM043_010895 [Ampulex compressa]